MAETDEIAGRRPIRVHDALRQLRLEADSDGFDRKVVPRLLRQRRTRQRHQG
jgi:uncharacterized protein (UPF0335 family)